MEILAMYDIADPKRLRKVEKTLKKFGWRVQKSVFECSLKESVIEELKNSVMDIMNLDEDSFKIYPLLNDARIKQTIIGQGYIPEFKEFVIV
jgi:CRISPR-associated protein Cas2